MQSIITYCVPDLCVWRIEWGLRALALGISRLDLAMQYSSYWLGWALISVGSG